MPNIEIAKLKVRRGTDSQRLLITPDQGELLATLDTRRVYLGTGEHVGGVVVGSKVHPPLNNISSLTALKSEVGDLVNANNTFYQLTASDYTALSSWRNVGTRVSSSTFEYDGTNALTLKLSSINSQYLNPNTLTNAIVIKNNLLQLDYNTQNFKISSNKLTINDSGVTEFHISPNSLSRGLSGGNGDKLYLNVDPSYFVFNGNTLSLSSAPHQSLEFASLCSTWFGQGIIYNGTTEKISTNLTDVDYKTIVRSVTGGIYLNPLMIGSGSGLVLDSNTPILSANVADVDGLTILRSSNGTIRVATSAYGSGLVYNSTTNQLSTTLASTDNISLTSNSGVVSLPYRAGLSGTSTFANVEVDNYGRISSHRNGISDILTGDSSLGTHNITNTLSSIFNGDFYGLSGLNITQFTALSSDNVTVVNLSSAGFITFENSAQTQNGKSLTRFAIPIFIY